MSNGIKAKRVDEAIELVGLTDKAKQRVGTYSLGMRQRLGLAGVLLGDPHTVVLDEPANGLDPEGIRWIRDVLVHLASRGKTVLVSSHLLSEVALMADELVVIGLGRLIDTGTVAEFVNKNAERWVRVRSPQIGVLAQQLSGNGWTVRPFEESGIDVYGASAAEIGDLAARHGVTLHELSPQQGSLEDAFLEATAAAQEYRSVAPPESIPPQPVPSAATSAFPPPAPGGAS